MKKSILTILLTAGCLLTVSSLPSIAKTLKTSIHIDASPEAVWHVLSDLNNHQNWDPFIREASGKLREGSQISVTIQSAPGEQIQFSPTILAAKPNKELRWKGNLWGMGFLFSGEHYFRLKRNHDNSTTLFHGEKFSGLLTHFFKGKFENQTRSGFKALNEALKARTELTKSAEPDHEPTREAK